MDQMSFIRFGDKPAGGNRDHYGVSQVLTVSNPMLMAVLTKEPDMANRHQPRAPARRSGAGDVPQNPLHKGCDL